MAKATKRNIVHIHEGDDLVIHWEMGLVLLSKARFHSYRTELGGSPQVTLEGISLRTMLPPGTTLQVAEVQPEHVDVGVHEFERTEPPVLQD